MRLSIHDIKEMKRRGERIPMLTSYDYTSAQILNQAGIPVQGHIGFTPQSVNTLGLKVQGRNKAMARKLINDAIALEQAGAFSVVLELVPAPLARVITEKLSIPTIGIGAGKWCDGQVQ